MTIRVLVLWEDESEIENACDLIGELREYVRDQGLYSGSSTVNIPFMKTFGIILKDIHPLESSAKEENI